MHRLTGTAAAAAVTAVLALVAAPAWAADSKVIYGPDDRIDYYEASANEQAAADATVALVSSFSLSTPDGGVTYNLPGGATGDQNNWCADEPFYNQPSPAFCSGFMVGPDLIATAGHCVGAGDCGSTSFVFGFGLDSVGDTTPHLGIPGDDVYDCVSVVGGELGGIDASDWRVVQVDRPIVGRTAVGIRTAAMGEVPDGEVLTVIGHPVGLPIKVANNAIVRDNGPAAYFVANLDTYGGNSGSAVFNTASIAAGTPFVEGILVRGETDFVIDGSCVRSNVCPDNGCRGEDVTRATEIEAAIDPDVDDDGIDNAVDNCPNDANPGQEDGDSDGAGDVCDCAPADPTIFPGAAEICGDGIDQSCDGTDTPCGGGCPVAPTDATAAGTVIQPASRTLADLALYLIPALALVALARRRRG